MRPPFVVGAFGSPYAQERSRLDEVLQRGSLIVVTLGTVPPFAFKDDKGELVGFDIDVARLAANALFRDPNKIEFVIVTSDGRWPAIESGRADMGVGGTTVYPDRAIRVAFTRAFIDSGISILVAKSSGIKSLEDLNQDKFIVANLNNPQMADRAAAIFPKAKVVTFDTPSGQVPRSEEWARTRAPDRHAHGGLFCCQQRQGFRGAADAAHRFAKQWDLPEARRLQVVALARYLCLRAAHGLALSKIHGALSEVVQEGRAAAEILSSASR